MKTRNIKPNTHSHCNYDSRLIEKDRFASARFIQVHYSFLVKTLRDLDIEKIETFSILDLQSCDTYEELVEPKVFGFGTVRYGFIDESSKPYGKQDIIFHCNSSQLLELQKRVTDYTGKQGVRAA